MQQLIDIVSKNGNLVAQHRPAFRRHDSTEVKSSRVPEVMRGLKVNGEAIYGTRLVENSMEKRQPVAAGSLHDIDTAGYTRGFSLTTKGKTLYAIELGWPSSGEAVLHSLGSAAVTGQKIGSIVPLGSSAKLAFASGCVADQLPPQAPGKYAYAFRITFEGATP